MQAQADRDQGCPKSADSGPASEFPGEAPGRPAHKHPPIKIVFCRLRVPSATTHAIEHPNPAHLPASAEGARFRRLFAAALDASAAASLILSDCRKVVHRRPVSRYCIHH
jgi:hypothetical protein